MEPSAVLCCATQENSRLWEMAGWLLCQWRLRLSYQQRDLIASQTSMSLLSFSLWCSLLPFPSHPPPSPCPLPFLPALSSAFLTHSSLSTCVLSLLLQTMLLTQQGIVKKVLKHYIPVNTTKMIPPADLHYRPKNIMSHYTLLHQVTCLFICS